jgi:hypothetical protein
MRLFAMLLFTKLLFITYLFITYLPITYLAMTYLFITHRSITNLFSNRTCILGQATIRIISLRFITVPAPPPAPRFAQPQPCDPRAISTVTDKAVNMATDMVVMGFHHTRVIAMVITGIIHNPEVVGPVTAGMLFT